MPQPSIHYACGRVGVLRRTTLGSAQMERLQSAQTYNDALRTLADIGFAAADSTDFQAAADAHVRKACELIRAVTPNPDVTDCFLLRYDVHNLKVLLKSRQLAQKPAFLSACGTIKVEKLRHAVSEHSYSALPPLLKQGLDALEKRIAIRFDPMLVDTELDKAMYRQVFANLAGHQDGALTRRYFQAKVDMQNLIMLLRLRAMGKEQAFFQGIALEGGKIPLRMLAKTFEENERLARHLLSYSTAVYQAAITASINALKLPSLEKAADDYLFSLFKGYRYATDSLEVLIAYLLQRQREATDVRLILTGKLNGFTEDAVIERMRELNG